MPEPVTALAVGGTALAGSVLQSNAARDAAGIQSEASQSGIEEQRLQFDAMRELLKPYTEAGAPALQQQQAFLGLQGPEAERAAIERIRSGETFQALARQGEEALLQNASATGGLRGGNIQGALAQFRPQLLAGLIDQQYSRLGGMTALGQQSAAGVGSSGIQSGENVANLMAQAAAAQAGGQLGSAKAYGNFLNLPAQFVGMQMGAGKNPGF
jgi:hypothetical protein